MPEAARKDITMHTWRNVLVTTGAALAVSVGAYWAANVHAQEIVPKYEFDPAWPNLPLPDRGIVGQVGGICVSQEDHVFLLNRQGLQGRELQNLDAGRLAAPIIEVDQNGTVIRSWGDPSTIDLNLHDCHIDKDNSVWIIGSRSGVAQKYSPNGSKLLLQIGKSGIVDSSDGSLKGKALNSDAPQFFGPAGIAVDHDNGDVYVADGELANGNRRIAVFDRHGKFLRQWRLHRTAAEKDIREVPHCLRLSKDGFVYVCDRAADRIQVFDKTGHFRRNIDIPWKNYTPPDGVLRKDSAGAGSAVALGFSPDPSQRFLYVANQANEQIDIVDRQTGKVLSTLGRGVGHFPGQFDHAHGIAVDSKGNVYVAEVDGRRVQRFKVVK